MIEKYVDSEELKRLLSTLGGVLSCIIIGGLFASIVVPGLRNANKPAAPAAVAPVMRETGWLNPAEFPPQRGMVIPPVDPATLMTPSAELTGRGKTLYEANCTACHGPQGRGDGPAAGTMNPKPRNLSSPDGWKNGYHAPAIFKTLKEGIAGTSMASFDYLSKKDRMALVHYVQSLGAFSHDTASSESMDALSRELASAGEKIPNRIPVSMAMARLEEEFAAPPPLAIEMGDQSPAAGLLRKVIADPARASQFLTQSSAWRISDRDLARSVVLEMPANGFSTCSAALSTDEWKTLQSELLKKVKSK